MGIDLQDKRVLVTGGTSGIGKAIALQVAQAGADVAFCGLTDDGAEAVKETITGFGRRVYFEAVDLADLDNARAFTDRAIDSLGGLDGLVNNAGANFKYGVLGSTFEGIQACMMLNFYAAWAIAQTAYPALKASGQGRIVNVSSIHTVHTEPDTFPYNASKAALGALTHALAHEWAADNILAVTIAPGWVNTPILDPGFAGLDDPAGERQRVEDSHLLGQMTQPDGVASLVVYLLSAANTALTGNTIIVDGGMHTVLTPRL